MSTSPSDGQLKGSWGRSQKAGQIPLAQGEVRTALRTPRSLPRVWRDTRRAEVYFLPGSGLLFWAVARTMSLWSGVWKEFCGVFV